jgi:hypothetical protein
MEASSKKQKRRNKMNNLEYVHKDRDGHILGTYRGTELRVAQSTVQVVDAKFVTAVINLLPGERVFHNDLPA